MTDLTRETLPVIDHLGPHDTDVSMFEQVAHNLRADRPVGGSHPTHALCRLIDREIARAQSGGGPLPVVAYKGDGQSDVDKFERMAWNLRNGYGAGGSNAREALARLIDREVARAVTGAEAFIPVGEPDVASEVGAPSPTKSEIAIVREWLNDDQALPFPDTDWGRALESAVRAHSDDAQAMIRRAVQGIRLGLTDIAIEHIKAQERERIAREGEGRGDANGTDGRTDVDGTEPDPAAMGSTTIRVMVDVDTDELREWAGRHADEGRHGVAAALYDSADRYEAQAAAGTDATS